MGLGYGSCYIMHVGGVFKRVEYFLVGEALNQSMKSLRLATNEQPLIISVNLWNMVDRFFVCENLRNALETDKYVKFIFGPGIKPKANTDKLRS